ncbi:MAG: hypothetical protein E6431_13935, partial [Bradyrhizobium sp.]|uniref:hypothetical protein n=1 Tax=Bradyrhizobium sp. TaxID=376 RepID=UPI0029117624
MTVSTWLPSALRRTTSVSVWAKLPAPVGSRWIVATSPLAAVVVTTRSFTEPSLLRSETVSIRLPSAPIRIVSVWSTWPSPSISRLTVLLSPDAEIAVTVRSSSAPLAAMSLIVSVRPPSALSTVTSVVVTAVPLPDGSDEVVTDSPLALTVLTVRSMTAPVAA